MLKIMPQRNNLRLYFFEFGTPSNKPKYANKQTTNKQKLSERFFKMH